MSNLFPYFPFKFNAGKFFYIFLSKYVGRTINFRAGRSCIDNIFCITQLIEKKKATDRELHLLFIDLAKAYDSTSMPLNKLWETLDGTAINKKLIEAIKALYEGSSSKVKVGNLITKGFKVTKELRQGCSLLQLYLTYT